jgi:hypothetical protein
MSKWAAPALVVLIASLPAAPAPAQSAGDSSARPLARLERRADSLARAWREATTLAAVADSVAHLTARGRLDTIVVGSLRLVTNPSPLPARAAAAQAWRIIDSVYGSEAERLRDSPILIHAIDPDSVAGSREHWGQEVTWDQDTAALAGLLLQRLPLGDPDREFRVWLGDALRPAPRQAEEWSDTYVSLVTAPYLAARRCFAGSLEACRSALGLDEYPAGIVLAYRDSSERRLATARVQSFFQDGGGRAAYQECQAGADSVCTELLAGIPLAMLPKPVSVTARLTLARLALSTGGREAYHRLAASAGAPIGARLSLAAGLPLDSLVSRWRARVIAARPAPVTLPSYGYAAGLGWVLCFGLCALGSSRWRAA